MMVMKEVKDLRRVSQAMQVPQERLPTVLEGSEEDAVGKVAEFWLGTKKPWKELREVLIKCDELPSAGLVCMMEMFASEGEALVDIMRVFNLFFSHRLSTESEVCL